MRCDWSVHLHSAVTSLCHVRALSSNVRVPGGHELQSPEYLLKTFFSSCFFVLYNHCWFELNKHPRAAKKRAHITKLDTSAIL